MPFGVLADLVLVVHLGFIGFVTIGALLALRRAWAPFVHLPALAWAVYVELVSGVCPLTPLENALRQAAGEAGYPGSFLEHYLMPLIYPPGLTPSLQVGLAAGLVLVNAILYAWVLVRRGVVRTDRRSEPRL